MKNLTNFLLESSNQTGKKYRLTDETIKVEGRTLYRIEALKSFNDGWVKKGSKGGYIEKEDNLSQEGDCWVYDFGKVYGDAKVIDNASVSNHAEVYGNAIISGDAMVYSEAHVYDNVKVYDNAVICDNTKVCDD